MFRSRIAIPAATLVAVILGALSPVGASAATIVRINTNIGNIDVELFDDAAPLTVDNFLNYATTGRYQNTIIHRSAPNFVIQGGAFTSNYAVQPTDAPVKNEPNHTNIRGTIAMAKQPDNPNSATNQWFINLANNASNLDNQNGGFTVFGNVVTSGMTVADSIAALPFGDFSDSRFGIPPQVDSSALPVRNYTQQNYDSFVDPTANNLVIINSVSVIGSYTPAFQNPDNRFDTDDNNQIVPQDVLRLVNEFNRNGERALPANFVGPLFVDVDGNRRFNSSDINRLVQHINDNGFTTSGLLSSFSSSSAFAFVPEPSGMTLAASAMALFLAFVRKRNAKAL